MGRQRARWLRVSAFLACERLEGAALSQSTGPCILHGVWHQHRVGAPLAGLPGVPDRAPLTLFVRLTNRSNRVSRPRELEAHLYCLDGPQLISRYRFLPQPIPPGIIIYLGLPLLPPPIPVAAWHEFLLVLDDDERTVLARTEVYLIP
jgi:hypothetical protein